MFSLHIHGVTGLRISITTPTYHWTSSENVLPHLILEHHHQTLLVHFLRFLRVPYLPGVLRFDVQQRGRVTAYRYQCRQKVVAAAVRRTRYLRHQVTDFLCTEDHHSLLHLRVNRRCARTTMMMVSLTLAPPRPRILVLPLLLRPSPPSRMG